MNDGRASGGELPNCDDVSRPNSSNARAKVLDEAVEVEMSIGRLDVAGCIECE